MRIFQVFLCILSLSCVAFADNQKEKLEVQAMCSKDADTYFEKNYSSGLTTLPEDSNGYINHYNSKLNKCFILISSHRSSGQGDNKIISDSKALYDVYEGKEFARWDTGALTGNNITNPAGICYALGKDCNPNDFQAIIKPYMEE